MPQWRTLFVCWFLANVNSSYMSSSVRLSVVCNVRVPYSSDWNFRQCFLPAPSHKVITAQRKYGAVRITQRVTRRKGRHRKRKFVVSRVAGGEGRCSSRAPGNKSRNFSIDFRRLLVVSATPHHALCNTTQAHTPPVPVRQSSWAMIRSCLRTNTVVYEQLVVDILLNLGRRRQYF